MLVSMFTQMKLRRLQSLQEIPNIPIFAIVLGHSYCFTIKVFLLSVKFRH